MISIHAPRVGSDGIKYIIGRYLEISIHAPRVGSDPYQPPVGRPYSKFQSTLPVWGATSTLLCRYLSYFDFNPRSPCGERLKRSIPDMDFITISIHAPRVGSDRFPILLRAIRPTISIHAPRVGSDLCACPKYTHQYRFQSTLPVWGATARQEAYRLMQDISIHAPRVGSDAIDKKIDKLIAEFQSTLPVWGATRALQDMRETRLFQATLPVWGATS